MWSEAPKTMIQVLKLFWKEIEVFVHDWAMEHEFEFDEGFALEFSNWFNNCISFSISNLFNPNYANFSSIIVMWLACPNLVG